MDCSVSCFMTLVLFDRHLHPNFDPFAENLSINETQNDETLLLRLQLSETWKSIEIGDAADHNKKKENKIHEKLLAKVSKTIVIYKLQQLEEP